MGYLREWGVRRRKGLLGNTRANVTRSEYGTSVAKVEELKPSPLKWLKTGLVDIVSRSAILPTNLGLVLMLNKRVPVLVRAPRIIRWTMKIPLF